MPASVFKRFFDRYLKLGYSPIARFSDSWPKAWSDYCVTPADAETMKRWAANPDAMIALACGFNGLVAIDCDTSDRAILAAALAALPQCRIARFGSKGFALLARYVGSDECRFAHIYQGEGKDKKPLIEIKGLGQNITVPPSIHAKTGKPYYWKNPETDEKPEGVIPASIDELPAVDNGDIERLREAISPWASKPRPAPESRPGFDPKKIGKSRYEAWYRAGLTNAMSALSGARDGRPSMLFRSVCALGAAVHYNFIPKLEFEAAFLDACDVNGLTARDGRHAIIATIDSGLRWAEGDDLPDLGEPKTRTPATRKRRANGADHEWEDVGVSPVEDKRNGLDPSPNEDERPIIEVRGGSLSQNATEAEQILFEAKAPIYHQAGVLVAPTKCSLVDNKGDIVHVPAISQMSATGVRDAIGKYARWQKWDTRAKKLVDVDPKSEVAQIILDRKGQGPHWRILAGVTSSPMLRHDATIAMKPGYDELSGWYLQNLPIMPTMPTHPNEKDARKAFGTLKELLDEFPFTDSAFPERPPHDTASYAVAMSAILTLPARPMMNVAPGHAARASEAGTGKTYLFNIASAIGLGTKCPIITLGTERDETEKRLGALMISGSQILCLDNVNGDLQDDMLGQIISEDEVSARVLGRSKMVKLTNRFVVYATGNNLQIVGDLNRRMLICEMDAVLEHPCERRFDHDPVAMVFQNRGKYVAACLTIIRAHALEGYPGSADLAPLVTFEKWTQAVRGALVWLGLRDPVESMETLKKADPQRLEQSAFVLTMAELFEPDYSKPVTVAEIVEEAQKSVIDGNEDARKRMKEILKDHGDRFGNVSGRRVGKWLKRIIGRRFGNLRLRGTNEKRPMMEYWVERVP